MKKIIAVILILSFITSPALARVNVKEGLEIPLRAEIKQTSKNLTENSVINMLVAESVYQNGVLIFKKDDKAALYVISVKKAGFLGSGGKLTIVDGEVYDVTGNKHQVNLRQIYSGKNKIYPKILTGISIFFLFPLALFAFVKGGQAEINPEQVINVRLDKSFDL